MCAAGAGRPRHATDGAADERERERWNHRYAERGVHPFAHAPGEWLAANRDLLTGGPDRRALDVACGDGRNAAYLARLGFAVEALDISDVAIDALSAAAASQGLSVTPRRLDLQRDPLPPGPYDVIAQLNYLQRSLSGVLADMLAPGGLLIVETVTRAHAERLGNRFDPRFLLEPGELLAASAGLDVLRYQEGIVERAGRPRAVASLVAQRPR